MVAPTQQRLPLFPLGRLVATPGAIAALDRSGEQPGLFLRRHVMGDWGDVGADDAKLNDEAVGEGTRILSGYRTKSGERIWIITEADRSGTTLLLPEEY